MKTLRYISSIAVYLLAAGAFAAHTVSVCKNEITGLTPDSIGIQYQWSTGETTQSIQVAKSTEGTYQYVCQVKKIVPIKERNLMENSGFENFANPWAGFSSDYEFLEVDPVDMYSTDGISGVWAISSNAHQACVNFAPVTAHEGYYFALFDADARDAEAIAWKASTIENPNLQIEAGKTYYFSFWSANINTGGEQGNPAELQFYITYNDAANNTIEQALGVSIKMKRDDHDWHQVEGFFVAPVTSSFVSIAIKNLNTSSNQIGNDFALDDIVFQTVDENSWHAVADTFNVVVKSCEAEVTELEICLGESVTLTPEAKGNKHQWSTGDTGEAITVEGTTVGEAFYECTTRQENITVKGNLIPASAGGFEFAPASPKKQATNSEGDIIQFQYLNFNKTGVNINYGSTTSAQNAADVKPDHFVSLAPKKGSYMLVVDGGAGSNSPVWMVRELKLKAGVTYRFSFWIANIDKKSEEHGESALPQIRVMMENSDDSNLELDAFQLTLQAGQWEYHEMLYTAPQALSWCHIKIYDMNTAEAGNDFALDDVRLEVIEMEGEPVVTTEIFKVTTSKCDDCIDTIVYRKWNDFLFVDNHYGQYVSYQWYENGVALAGETGQYLYLPNHVMVGNAYYVEATRQDGLVDKACEAKFEEFPTSVASTKYNIQARRERTGLCISQNAPKQITVSVFTVTGTLVAQSFTSNTEIRIEAPAAGMYIVVVDCEEGRLLSEKVTF